MAKVFYTVPAPYSSDEVIEVYGDGDMGWYEWRVVSDLGVVHDTRDIGYGCAEIALRDALVHVTKDF